VAGTTCVLLLGETGTGKELIARRCMPEAPRVRPLMRELRCPAADLIESELFGHEKAFTGATQARQGSFELRWRDALSG